MIRPAATVCMAALLAASPRCIAQAQSARNATLQAEVSASDIVVEQPNILAAQAMPLGNGRLGAAVWAADGLTIQLNRSDTLPGRLSPAQVAFPGLRPMIADRQFHGRLSLYDGNWVQSGAGMSAQVAVDQHRDRLIVDVSGANPLNTQSVVLRLWQPRTPAAIVDGKTVLLAEHWLDDRLPGASGLPFGSLAAARVVGRNIVAVKLDRMTVAIRFRPMPDGRYRVIIAAPAFDGRVEPVSAAATTLSAPVDPAGSRRYWHDFWARACLIFARSDDGRAAYFESMRMLYLYYAAALSRGTVPGSQAGVADLFSSVRDEHFWDPAAFWEWNLRMQVAANLSAGLPALNAPYFALYRNNLDAIHRWTREKMSGRGGICMPETMRFNGVGIEHESAELRAFPIVTHSCDATWSAVANARTLSTGAEVGLWVWETYLKTGDRAFLEANYPLMAEAARFLLAYQQPGADGLLHTFPSNAHETQADVHDPTTDISAIRALYPATIAASRELSRDTGLAEQLQAALRRTPELPLAPARGDPDATLPATAQTQGPVIGASYDAAAPFENSENIGLEPLWPYSLIDSDSPLFDTALRTYAYRPFRELDTWSSDPIDAARLGLGAEVSQSLYRLTQLFQIYPNGMADWGGGRGEFYIEQMAIAAQAMAESLVQDHGRLLHIGWAIPPHWSISGTVYVRGNARVTVEARGGALTQFALHADSAHQFQFANPWPGRQIIEIPMASPGARSTLIGETMTVNAEPGETYSFLPADSSDGDKPAAIGFAATGLKILGRASIGLGAPCCTPPANYDAARDLKEYRVDRPRMLRLPDTTAAKP